MKKITRKQLIDGIGKLQDLIGIATTSYWEDRSPNRAEKVIKSLEKAFDLCVELRSTDDPELIVP